MGLSFPALSSSIALAPLIGWMLILTIKHVIADFLLQNTWMAVGKDRKTGWALPLLAHCGVHFACTTLIMVIIAPRFWFVGLIDFAIHITIDRLKGICASNFGVTLGHPWFWTLIGIDQALHHLTDFVLAIFVVGNS